MNKQQRLAWVVIAAASVSLATPSCAESVTGPGTIQDFEVWAIDQSPAPGRAFGGLIHIFRDTMEANGTHTLARTTEVIDLSGATATLSQSSTGALPVQAHNVTFNATQSHALIAFLASGHVAILNAATRQPVACLQM